MTTKLVRLRALACLGFVIGLLPVQPAMAAKFLYSVTGTGTGTLDGTGYTGAFTLEGLAETTDLNPDPTITAFRFDSFTVTLAGLGSAVATDPVFFFTNRTGGIGGVLSFNLSENVLRNYIHFLDPNFTTYDPATPLTAEPVNFVTSINPLLRTDKGNLSWTYPLSGGTLNVSAATAAVPEPATWAMMIVGFGLVGTSMRRYRLVKRVAG